MVNALGFALQLVSAMFVVLRPFGGKRYRVPRRVLLTTLAVYGAAASFAFPLVTYYVDVIDAALLGNFYLLAVALEKKPDLAEFSVLHYDIIAPDFELRASNF